MTQKVRKAVFPAAGLGTRFLPATKASPKEMLPLVDKPLIQYVVEEAVASGIESVIIVTGRGKTSIEDHFDVSFELEKLLEERGKLINEERARQAAEIARPSTMKVRLQSMLGFFDAQVNGLNGQEFSSPDLTPQAVARKVTSGSDIPTTAPRRTNSRRSISPARYSSIR